jgi:hypothetical protein
MSTEIATGTVMRGFGGTEMARTAETAISAAAAAAKAAVEARYAVAIARPRDVDQARVKLLAACARPHFAKAAEYAVPRGGKTITGATVRFIEAAIGALGNISVESTVLYEDDTKRIVRVTATDLETNIAWSSEAAVSKTVERKARKNNKTQQWEAPAGDVLGERLNSYGDTVYIMRATDEEVEMAVAARVARVGRSLATKLIPADLIDEGLEKCRAVLHADDAQDPAQARNKLVDAFAGIGVQPADLARYLGHPLASASPAELRELRPLYAAIRDGETTIAAAIAGRNADVIDVEPESGPQASAQTAPPQAGQRARRQPAPAPQAMADAEEAP